MEKNKVLIIRFSSFGDIVQCSTTVEFLARNIENPEIHWITRSEFKELVSLNDKVSKVISLDRKSGLFGLLKLIRQLKRENYYLVYDAHNNLRSNIIYLLFKLTFTKTKWATRSKDRFKRIMLFNFRKNLFDWPFKGIDSFLRPLKFLNTKDNDFSVKYNFPTVTVDKILNIVPLNELNIITIVPSAAWPMKRWPIEYWKELIKILPNYKFVILGGKDDKFCEEIKAVAKDRVINLAGELSLIESSALVAKSRFIISADTGLLHVADVLKVKGLSLMGPSAFGFTKSHLIKTLEVSLDCRPCSKDGSGKCTNSVYQKCMVDLTPKCISEEVKTLLN